MALPQTPEQMAAALKMLKDWRPAKEILLSGFTSFPIYPPGEMPMTLNMPAPTTPPSDEVCVNVKLTTYFMLPSEDMELCNEHQKEVATYLIEQLDRRLRDDLVGRLCYGVPGRLDY